MAISKLGLQELEKMFFDERGMSFPLKVSMGLVPGFSTLDKFGENPIITTTTDPEDIWEGGSLYTYSTTADIQSIASTAADTQDISILGLDENWEEVEQTVTLTGTTRVALPTPLIRVYRMENEGSTNLTGVVRCYTGTGTIPAEGDPSIRAIINNGNNQTLMALYTVPAGKVGFLFRGELGCKFTAGPQATDYAVVDYLSRRPGGVFKIKKRLSLVTTGVPIYQDTRSFPDIVPEMTDIVLRVEEVSADMGVWGAFDMLIVDKEYLTDELQAALGML